MSEPQAWNVALTNPVGSVVTEKTLNENMADAAFRATATRAGPRAASPFHPGEFVVYPSLGVGKIEDIGNEVISGHPLNLVRISFDDCRMTLRIPVARVHDLGLRKLASYDTLTRALRTLSGRPHTSRKAWAVRMRAHLAKIRSGEVHALAEVLRDLQADARSFPGATGRRALFGLALARLAAELAAVTGTTREQALIRIRQVFEHTGTGWDDDQSDAPGSVVGF